MMSTFHERKITTSSAVTCLCWKQTAPSYLAVGTSKGMVKFYWSDCTECNFPSLSYQSRTCKTRHVTLLRFHPIYDILIVVWSDGVMRSWNCDKGTISSQMSPHCVINNSYLNVLFNENGTRLISADYRGVISIWSCKINGSLNLLYTFKLKYGCSHITLYENNNNHNNHNNNNQQEEEIKISGFYMTNNSGKIYLTTDDGHCNDILQIDKNERNENDEEIHFRLLQYIVSYNKLIFITEDMTLYIYDILNNNMNELELNKSFKLSIKVNNVNVICSYLFDGLIAICNEQSMIHIFDILNNDNYILSLTDSRHNAAPNDSIDKIKFIESTKVLIGITCKHRIVLWKYKYSYCSDENDWIILPPITLQQNILYIDAGLSSQFYNPNDIGIAIFVENNNNKSTENSTDSIIDGELKVFCETKLHYKYCNGYTFIQFAQNRLLIYLSDDKMKKIRTPFTILIVANAGNLVFLSNGEQAELYMIDRDSAPFKIYEWNEMLCSSACIHLLDDDLKSLNNQQINNNPMGGDQNAIKNWKNVQNKLQSTMNMLSVVNNKNNKNNNKIKAASANIIVCYHNNIRIYNIHGSLKTTLTFQEHEGYPITMDLNLSTLAVVTTENILKVWDLTGDLNIDRNKRMPKSIIPQRKLDEYLNGVESIKMNATSNKISIQSIDNDNNSIYIYDIEKDECYSYKLDTNLMVKDHFWEQNDGRFLSVLWKKISTPGTKKNNNNNKDDGGDGDDDDDDDDNNDSSNESDETSLFDVASINKMDESIDFTDDEMRRASDSYLSSIKSTRKASMLDMTESEAECASEIDYGVISFFIGSDGIILPQEMFPTKWKYVGLHVPDFIFISINNKKPKVIRKRIRDFIGINNIDSFTKENLMNFSYYLSFGDLDEAYRSVQNIKSSSVWENMARMTVKTRRLDVAEICISNLSSSKGTSSRIASSLFFEDDKYDKYDADDKEEKEDNNLKLAMIAIDLKMYDDAEELLKQCDRYDLVVKMYQALGRWINAIEICEKYDRMNLNSAYYQYAIYLQQSGKIENAIKFYEKSDCSLKIAQMLYQNKHFKLLKNYINNSNNKKLLKWYAEYLESNENYNEAMIFYERANDYTSMVRICCEINDILKAETIINDNNNNEYILGASYHLASYYEDNENINKAIKYYKKSKAYHHALRLAKDNKLNEILLDIALKIPDCILTLQLNPNCICIAAQYFEDIGDLNKAVLLYKKAGNINKAMDICINGQLFDTLRNIALSLLNNNNNNNKTENELDPNVAIRFSEYFMEYKQYEKALSMLIIAKQYKNALLIISNYGITLNMELSEKLTPPKDYINRNEILLNLASILTQQQLYHIACKKYTQCGDKINAIKCLIKTGDTKKIIYYTLKIRNNDANILTANYLQSLDWHSNTEYTKLILQFYNASKAYEQLAFFYDLCAQIEIDDYRDYDKALRALKQALKQIKKSNNNNQHKLKIFETKINFVNRFSSARKLAESNPNEMIEICESLIKQENNNNNNNINNIIRIGDVYALMIEYYHSINNMNKAYQIIQRMKKNNIILQPYLDKNIIQNIYNALGIDINQHDHDNDDDDDDIIEEQHIQHI